MGLKKALALLYLILLATACIYAIRHYPSIASKIPKANINPEKISPEQPVNIVSIKTGNNTITATIYRSFIKPTKRHATITINQTKQETLLTPGQITTLTYNTPQKPTITIKH